jgi:heme-degrading monooxygenase HmoA
VYARVSAYSGDMDSFIRHFQSVIVVLEKWNGLDQVRVLVNRETGRAMTISIWADRESMEASDAVRGHRMVAAASRECAREPFAWGSTIPQAVRPARRSPYRGAAAVAGPGL